MNAAEGLEALDETVEPLIRSYLERRGSPGEQLPGGLVAAPLGGATFDAPWQLWLATGGPERKWLVVQVRAAHRAPRDTWPRVLMACNAWNQTGPLTKAWLAVDDWETASDGGLVLEASLPIDRRLGQDVLDRFLDTVAQDALGFWQALGGDG